ncbi:MAG: ribosomal protein S18-alanine N-acetyltransferase [Cyanobacteria bacterium]|nr:ribosomal protein S18-alanine N-acetyltransferase [Cyanobacteriota bacterium]
MLSSSQQPIQQLDSQQLLFRRMRKEDLSDVMEIESVSFGRHHWSEDSFMNEMKNQLGRYYSLHHQGIPQVIGYCGYWLIFDEVHITTVAVRNEFRRKSLGELILVHILDKCMGQTVKWVTLEVRVSNTNAQNLYYKYGFESMGTRTKYYQDNQEDALIMTTPDISSQGFRDRFRANKLALENAFMGFPEGFGK